MQCSSISLAASITNEVDPIDNLAEKDVKDDKKKLSWWQRCVIVQVRINIKISYIYEIIK